MCKFSLVFNNVLLCLDYVMGAHVVLPKSMSRVHVCLPDTCAFVFGLCHGGPCCPSKIYVSCARVLS